MFLCLKIIKQKTFKIPSVIFLTKEDLLLLIGKAQYKFVLGGDRRTFWMQNECSPPNNCVMHNVVEE